MPNHEGRQRWVQSSYALLDCDDPRVTAATIAVYTGLRSFCDSSDHCWPSVRAVAQRAHVSIRTARSHIRLLEVLNFVEVIRDGGQGRHHTCLYKVKLEPTVW